MLYNLTSKFLLPHNTQDTKYRLLFPYFNSWFVQFLLCSSSASHFQIPSVRNPAQRTIKCVLSVTFLWRWEVACTHAHYLFVCVCLRFLVALLTERISIFLHAAAWCIIKSAPQGRARELLILGPQRGRSEITPCPLFGTGTCRC